MGSDPGEQLKKLRDIAVHLICGFILTLLVLIAYSAHAYIFELFLGRAKEKDSPSPPTPCSPQNAPKLWRIATPKKPSHRSKRSTQADTNAHIEPSASTCKAEINNANAQTMGKKEAEALPRPPDSQRSNMPLSVDAPSQGQIFRRPRRVYPQERALPSLQNLNSKASQK
jgi:hypothetical protein